MQLVVYTVQYNSENSSFFSLHFLKLGPGKSLYMMIQTKLSSILDIVVMIEGMVVVVEGIVVVV